MKIATIYNYAEKLELGVHWDCESKSIYYTTIDGERCEDTDENADTLEEAIDDTYARHYIDWDINIVDGISNFLEGENDEYRMP